VNVAAEALTAESVLDFERVIGRGGVAVFPADTVYGIACNPGSVSSVERMFALKQRAEDRPAAAMFFQLERALTALEWLSEDMKAAIERLLPGPLTLVLPNPEGRYALARGGTKLGLRVPRLEGALAPLAQARVAVLQTSANPSGGPDARRVADVDAAITAGADLVLDGGELAGTPSSVVDLTGYESGEWSLLREAAVSRAEVEALLS
jgi:L-threonylcarbamoyladenylate synthase